MDELLNELFSASSSVEPVTLPQLVIAIFLTFGLSLIVGYVYRVTHQGTSYSQTTVHTMVIMAVVVAVIMIIIGSNIARAFSLVGALSIIRFRNAVKESRDVAFFFLAMAVGMACGTGFYGIAIVFTMCISVMIYAMTRFSFGAKTNTEELLRIEMHSRVDYKEAFSEVFHRYLESDHLLTVDSDGSEIIELVYTVRLRKKVSEHELLGDLRKIDRSIRSQLIKNTNTVSI